MDYPGRILALDIGDVRTGVAVTDPSQTIASPCRVVKQPSRAKAIAEIRDIVAEFEPVLVVAGLPLDAEGGQGPQAQKVVRFVELLREAVSVDIVFEDERYITFAADEVLREAEVRGKQRKLVVDKVAATQILQSYLERRRQEEDTKA